MEETKLMQEIMRDHPRPNYFTGQLPTGNCPSARDAMKLLGIKQEERRTGGSRQMQIHMNGTIW